MIIRVQMQKSVSNIRYLIDTLYCPISVLDIINNELSKDFILRMLK